MIYLLLPTDGIGRDPRELMLLQSFAYKFTHYPKLLLILNMTLEEIDNCHSAIWSRFITFLTFCRKDDTWRGARKFKPHEKLSQTFFELKEFAKALAELTFTEEGGA